MELLDASTQQAMRTQLQHRRDRLAHTIAETRDTTRLVALLKEVEAALKYVDSGSYGVCEVCHESIDEEHLKWDSLVRVCLSHLSEEQQHAIERDLDLASKIQTTLLPARHIQLNGWDVSYLYAPAGFVGGDYCDIVKSELDHASLYFFLGDVSGKGVAASLLMSHLHAIVRSLVTSNSSVSQMTEQANRLFHESTMSTHYATLVSGRAMSGGEVQICNAGHCPPLVLHNGSITAVESTGLPIGLFSGGGYAIRTLRLSPGDSLIVYTDGLTESRNPSDVEYGTERVKAVAARHRAHAPQSLVDALVTDVDAFRSGAQRADDLTVMVLARTT